MPEQNVIDVNHLSIQFNLANQKVNNLKEYAIKMAKGELMFQEFLALKDVNLHVKKGEAWALIGRNGSGKSTLLKTITGILKPYHGTVRVRGSIAPMIELGAGFDPELTARENIFLNGAVLGYSRKFMEAHFDEIVRYASVIEQRGADEDFTVQTALDENQRFFAAFGQENLIVIDDDYEKDMERCLDELEK